VVIITHLTHPLTFYAHTGFIKSPALLLNWYWWSLGRKDFEQAKDLFDASKKDQVHLAAADDGLCKRFGANFDLTSRTALQEATSRVGVNTSSTRGTYGRRNYTT
jgi:hypothetical protein